MKTAARIVARPMAYIFVGWLLVALAGVMVVLVLCFPPAHQPQYPDAMPPLQSLICFPGTIFLLSAGLFWMGYRVGIVADENGVKWKQSRVWRTLGWDEVALCALRYDESGQHSSCLLVGKNGQQVMWARDWSNQRPLGELIGRKLEIEDSMWTVRFVYGGERWWEKIGMALGLVFFMVPGFIFVRFLWVDWKTTWAPLPSHWLVVSLVAILVSALLYAEVHLIHSLVTRHFIGASHRGESIDVRGDTLTLNSVGRIWTARLEDVRLFRERNGDWRFETSQGSFVVERFVGWRSVLQMVLEERVFHLRFDDKAASLHFGFGTRENRILSGFALFFAMATAGGISLSSVLVPNPDGEHGPFNVWIIALYGVVPTLGSLFGFYTCKRMSYEVSDAGLWRQGLWKQELMGWGDVRAVRADRNGGYVEGVVDGRSVRWALSPFLTVERPYILRKLVMERAPHAITRKE